MPELQGFSGREVIGILVKIGFVARKGRGSHSVLRRGNTVCVIPLHDELAVGTLRSVLRQAEVSVEEFLRNV